MNSFNHPLAALAVGTGLLLAGSAAAAPELWNGARLGMTPTEVEAVFPQAAQGETSPAGEDQIVSVDHLQAAGHPVTALFDFRQSRLRSVELHLNGPGGAATSEDVRARLTSKYGPPANCRQELDRCEWRVGSVTITMLDSQRDGGQGVEVLYAAAPETDGGQAIEVARDGG